MLAVTHGMAQTFEGTVKWSMKMEVTDPKLKADMEQAELRMNDPANQAKMKEMEAKMNDPQMKAMMEANPQLKTQMENAMKAMQGGGGMASMMPKGMTIKIKGANTLSKMEGGMMDGTEVLNMRDKNMTVQIDRKNKTYSVLPQDGPDKKADVKVTKTSETAKIAGYACTKYIAEVKERGTTVKQIFWTTTDIKDFDMKSLVGQRMQGNRAMFYEQVEGVPMKMEMTMPQGTMVMEALEVKRSSVAAEEVTLPADFKEVKMQIPGRF